MTHPAYSSVMNLLQSYDQDSNEQSHHLWMASELLKLITGGSVTAGQRTHLRYQMAICLDLGGKPFDALEVFNEIIKEEPHNLEYQHSMLVIQGRVERLAQEAYLQDEKSPVLINYHEILNANLYSPFWLCCAVARIFAQSGRKADAKALMLHLHELTPKDPDSLRECLRVARMSGDQAWEHDVLDQIEQVREKRPHDPRYGELI